jgi:hypothetical protein
MCSVPLISTAREHTMTTITQRVLSFVSAATLAAVLTPASVPTFAATAAAAGELKCDVPFSFSVNGRELPAGVYAITAEHSTMLIKGVSRGAFALGVPMINTERSRAGARLVFDKYGDQYTLREVWTDSGSGQELPAARVSSSVKLQNRKVAMNVERIVIKAI